jgi:4-amino-4-deoxy-L-arabinose transferase-like glycosyltransferase
LPPQLWLALLTLVAGLVLFSQTWAWYGDEGFHLLASQLINSGKKPYVDFIFPQTPIWAYVDAGWMQIFGETWRSSHLLSALLTGGSIILSAGFVYGRVPESWRLTAALIAAILIGLNILVIGFGTIGQAYGICLFLIVASFRLVTKAVAESRGALFLWSGLCAGGAAGSSLLSAPVLPVLFVWAAWRSTADRRLKTCIWFIVGAGISFLPLVWLALLAPRQTLFNIFEYHFFYRTNKDWAVLLDWEALLHNIKILTTLINSGQFSVLLLFAGMGLLVLGRSQWDTERKAEFYLCGWLAGGLAVFLATARVTFPQYFVLLVPFLSILASVGIVATASWLRTSNSSGSSPPERAVWLVPGVLALFLAGFPWWLLQQYRQPHWPQIEERARVVAEVTPEDGWIWADDTLLFAARRAPPPGLEYRDSQRLRVGSVGKLHLVSYADVLRWLAAGRFATIVICGNTNEWLGEHKIGSMYNERITVNGCDILWNKSATGSER